MDVPCLRKGCGEDSRNHPMPLSLLTRRHMASEAFAPSHIQLLRPLKREARPQADSTDRERAGNGWLRLQVLGRQLAQALRVALTLARNLDDLAGDDLGNGVRSIR